MVIGFVLTMPRNNAWDGKWSGDKDVFGIVRSIRDKKKAAQIVESEYYHDFGDGWCAKVTATELTPSKAAALRKRSKGFAGYDWMVASIIEDGKIVPPSRSGRPCFGI